MARLTAQARRRIKRELDRRARQAERGRRLLERELARPITARPGYRPMPEWRL